jgi:Ca2+-binding EF-hand superfamily protein
MKKRRGHGGGGGQGMRPGSSKPSFEDFDLDGDGSIAEEEFYAARNSRIQERVLEGRRMKNLRNAPAFGDLDTDGDGSLSREEFAAHQARHPHPMPQQ